MQRFEIQWSARNKCFRKYLIHTGPFCDFAIICDLNNKQLNSNGGDEFKHNQKIWAKNLRLSTNTACGRNFNEPIVIQRIRK